MAVVEWQLWSSLPGDGGGGIGVTDVLLPSLAEEGGGGHCRCSEVVGMVGMIGCRHSGQ